MLEERRGGRRKSSEMMIEMRGKKVHRNETDVERALRNGKKIQREKVTFLVELKFYPCSWFLALRMSGDREREREGET